MLNSNFYEKTDCYTTGRPLYVTFSDVYMTKTKDKNLKPANPRFHKRFVPDIFSKKKKDQPDLLFENLNNHHPNIKYTKEIKDQKFLDTKIIYKGNQIKPEVQRKTQHQDKYTILPDFFDVPKSLVFPEILYCSRRRNF